MWASLGFAKTTYNLVLFGTAIPCYAAISSLALNLVVSAVLSVALNALLPRTDVAAIVAGGEG